MAAIKTVAQDSMAKQRQKQYLLQSQTEKQNNLIDTLNNFVTRFANVSNISNTSSTSNQSNISNSSTSSSVSTVEKASNYEEPYKMTEDESKVYDDFMAAYIECDDFDVKFVDDMDNFIQSNDIGQIRIFFKRLSLWKNHNISIEKMIKILSILMK